MKDELGSFWEVFGKLTVSKTIFGRRKNLKKVVILIGLCLFFCLKRQVFDNFSGSKIARFSLPNTSSDSVRREVKSLHPSHFENYFHKMIVILFFILISL